MKIENDAADVTAGVRHGRTLGGPDRAPGRQPRLRQLGGADEPVAGRGRRARGAPARAPATPTSSATMKYGLTDVRNVLERASARETAARVAGGGAGAGRSCARSASRSSRTSCRSARCARRARDDLRARGLRRRRRVAGALPGPRRLGGDGRGDQPAAQGATSRSAASSRCAPSGSCRASARTSPGRSAWTGASARRSSRSRRSRAWASATASTSPGCPARQAHDEIFYERGARLLPRDQPRGRARGRHDHRRAAGRARRDEAAADADQAAALGRHRDPRARPGAARAHRLGDDPGRRRGRGGDGRVRARRRLPATSSAATTSTTCARRRRLRAAASAGGRGSDDVAGARAGPGARLHRLHGRRQDERRARRRRACSASRPVDADARARARARDVDRGVLRSATASPRFREAEEERRRRAARRAPTAA